MMQGGTHFGWSERHCRKKKGIGKSITTSTMRHISYVLVHWVPIPIINRDHKDGTSIEFI